MRAKGVYVVPQARPVRHRRASRGALLRPRARHRAPGVDEGPLPVIEGTLIRLQVDRLPGELAPRPVWLWCPVTDASPADVDRLWQAFLHRFDLEHTFRLFKQVLGWTVPKLRDPAGCGPADLADHRLLCPAPPRPAAGGGPAPALGTAPARPADPGPGPPGVPEHPRDPALPGRRTETRQARPRAAARVEEPAPGTPPRRGKKNEEGPHAQGTTRTRRLKNKLRGTGRTPRCSYRRLRITR